MAVVRALAIVGFVIAAIGQTILYVAILFEHKPSASVARFAFMKIPRNEDLTARGRILARWWWGASLLAAVTLAISVLTASLP